MPPALQRTDSVCDVISKWALWEGCSDSVGAAEACEDLDAFQSDDFESVLAVLRKNTIGRDQVLEGPFGQKLKVYLDYTASGQGLHCINRYMTWIRENFANTHTEDSATGRFMTDALHAALRSIEQCVNAQDKFVAIAAGTGCTGALLRLQQILGVYIPPAAWGTLAMMAGADEPTSKVGWPMEPVPLGVISYHGADVAGQIPEWLRSRETVKSFLRQRGVLPLVLVGGYEHHSNEISWRSGLCDVFRVPLTKDYQLNLEAMETILEQERAAQPKRAILGSFSACSNVTGMNTDLRAVSKLLRRYGARFFVDFAASGPYVEIDCCPKGNEDLFDGFVLSPHKFLGGDGSCGLLVLRKSIYNLNLPPTFAGGGTVQFVGQNSLAFSGDIVERENAGTPGALQIFQCALAFELKRAVGPQRIEQREQELLSDFFSWVKVEHPDSIFLLGNQDPQLRQAIVSFNVIGPTPLHPRFVTVLLSDLFGVQTRAGCSCAGPHGLDLLGGTADHERAWASHVASAPGGPDGHNGAGLSSVKPGWCRLNLHYTMDKDELWYVKEVLTFLVQHGASFLSVYSFDCVSGAWEYMPPEYLRHRLEDARQSSKVRPAKSAGDSKDSPCWKSEFSLDAALEGGHTLTLGGNLAARRAAFEAALRKARQLAAVLPGDLKLAPPAAPFPQIVLPSHGPQPFFCVAEGQVHNEEEMARRIRGASFSAALSKGGPETPRLMASAVGLGVTSKKKSSKAWMKRAIPRVFRRAGSLLKSS